MIKQFVWQLEDMNIAIFNSFLFMMGLYCYNVVNESETEFIISFPSTANKFETIHSENITQFDWDIYVLKKGEKQMFTSKFGKKETITLSDTLCVDVEQSTAIWPWPSCVKLVQTNNKGVLQLNVEGHIVAELKMKEGIKINDDRICSHIVETNKLNYEEKFRETLTGSLENEMISSFWRSNLEESAKYVTEKMTGLFSELGLIFAVFNSDATVDVSMSILLVLSAFTISIISGGETKTSAATPGKCWWGDGDQWMRKDALVSDLGDRAAKGKVGGWVMVGSSYADDMLRKAAVYGFTSMITLTVLSKTGLEGWEDKSLYLYSQGNLCRGAFAVVCVIESTFHEEGGKPLPDFKNSCGVVYGRMLTFVCQLLAACIPIAVNWLVRLQWKEAMLIIMIVGAFGFRFTWAADEQAMLAIAWQRSNLCCAITLVGNVIMNPKETIGRIAVITGDYFNTVLHIFVFVVTVVAWTAVMHFL